MSTYLFDFYGVLLRHRPPAPKEALLRFVGAEDPAAFWTAYNELRPAYDAGAVSDERWWRQMQVCLGLPDFDISEAVAQDFEPCTAPDLDVVGVAQELLGAGNAVGVLSNIPVGLGRMVRERNESWLKEFTAVVLSGEIGVVKPDKRAFDVAVDALGANAKDTLFIDDTQGNVDAARAAGLRGYLYDGNLAELRAECGLS